jgi:hypothetical protein
MKAKIILIAAVALMLVSFTVVSTTGNHDNKQAEETTSQNAQGGFSSEDPDQWR